MDILDLTTTEAVRATIGVDSSEFTDTAFTEHGLVNELEVDLFTWFPLWKTLMADATGTDVINMQKKSVKNYAKYFVAVRAFAGANQRFLQRKSDGEVEEQRYNQRNIADQREELIRLKDVAKAAILELITDHTPTIGTGKYTQFARAKANRDVITE